MNANSSYINSEILESNKGELCFNFEPGEFWGKERLADAKVKSVLKRL
jgi:hypothetical protein